MYNVQFTLLLNISPHSPQLILLLPLLLLPPLALKLPTLPNFTHAKRPSIKPLPLERLGQLPRRLKHILLSKHPRTPMHTQRLLTLCIDKNVGRILGIRMHGAEHEAGLVRANGDQSQVKGTTVHADLCKRRTHGQVCVFRAVVVCCGGEERDGAVACVAVGRGGKVSMVYHEEGRNSGETPRRNDLTYPANQTLEPPDSTLQLAQRVLHLSNGVRALTC
jgi:hypothetical protein